MEEASAVVRFQATKLDAEGMNEELLIVRISVKGHRQYQIMNGTFPSNSLPYHVTRIHGTNLHGVQIE